MGLKLRMTGDNLLVEPDAAKEMSEGGNIHIPKEAQERSRVGTVLAIGPGKLNHIRGEYIEPEFKVGDRVMYRPYAGGEINISAVEGKGKAMILKSEDVMCVIEDTDKISISDVEPKS